MQYSYIAVGLQGYAHHINTGLWEAWGCGFQIKLAGLLPTWGFGLLYSMQINFIGAAGLLKEFLAAGICAAIGLG